MENASKALIIAGAILLAIIIITLGLAVVNNARTQMGGANLSKEQIQTFNSQWENFVGKNKTAAEVKAMYSAVIANNAAETQSDEKRYVNIVNSDTASTTGQATAPTLSIPSITSAKTYTIVAGYANNGLIVELAYNENT